MSDNLIVEVRDDGYIFVDLGELTDLVSLDLWHVALAHGCRGIVPLPDHKTCYLVEASQGWHALSRGLVAKSIKNMLLGLDLTRSYVMSIERRKVEA